MVDVTSVGPGPTTQRIAGAVGAIRSRPRELQTGLCAFPFAELSSPHMTTFAVWQEEAVP